ncbi:DUF6325 family protein [Brevibacterium linens]|uniref:DUF6325 family protein n=1 Tax=Brevibacterium linens TaxID=1703 RepID=UPI003BF53FAC
MTEFRYGPVELYLVELDGNRPESETIAALKQMVASGTVRVLDILLVSRDEDGELTTIETAQEMTNLGLTDAEPLAPGLTGEADVSALAEYIPLGRTAFVVALELTYQRELSQRLAESGSRVLRTEQIPAPIVNAMVDVLMDES